MPDDAKALLFDLGGVLIEVDFARAFEAWSCHSALSAEQIRQRFSFDAPYCRHERGEIDAAAYFEHLARTLELDASPAQIEAGWNAIYAGEVTAVRALVEQARVRLPCYGFSNTNAAHMSVWSRLYPGVVQALDEVFVSHRLRARKPERRAFERVAELTALRCSDFVFFDDLQGNVDAADAAGMRGVLVRSPADVRQALDALGLLGDASGGGVSTRTA